MKAIYHEEHGVNVARWRRPLVFTNGVFDIVHIGHIRGLSFARKLGASLIVGLNSDQSVKTLGKGDDRPITPDSERAEVIASIRPVSAVIIFNNNSPISLIEVLRPDVYVKGGDYEGRESEEVSLIRRQGGVVAYFPYIHGVSSSKIINKIRSRGCL